MKFWLVHKKISKSKTCSLIQLSQPDSWGWFPQPQSTCYPAKSTIKLRLSPRSNSGTNCPLKWKNLAVYKQSTARLPSWESFAKSSEFSSCVIKKSTSFSGTKSSRLLPSLTINCSKKSLRPNKTKERSKLYPNRCWLSKTFWLTTNTCPSNRKTSVSSTRMSNRSSTRTPMYALALIRQTRLTKKIILTVPLSSTRRQSTCCSRSQALWMKKLPVASQTLQASNLNLATTCRRLSCKPRLLSCKRAF